MLAGQGLFIAPGEDGARHLAVRIAEKTFGAARGDADPPDEVEDAGVFG
jgi:hypothetical protein